MFGSFSTLWTLAHQAPLTMTSDHPLVWDFPDKNTGVGYSTLQEYWSRVLYPLPGDIPKSGIESESLVSPAVAGGFFTTNTTWERTWYITDTQ